MVGLEMTSKPGVWATTEVARARSAVVMVKRIFDGLLWMTVSYNIDSGTDRCFS